MGFDFSKSSFLVVDDMPEMRSSIKKMLVASGANNIEDARDGKEAIKKIEKNKFDVILCDYNLGEGKDGQQVLEEVKVRNLIGSSTVFMMLTAENTMEMVMGAMEYHPDGYLTKPFTKGVLQERLGKIVERKSNLKDIEKAIQRKDYSKAVALCDAKIQEQPKNTLELMKIKSDLLLNLGNYSEAQEIFEKILSMRDVTWAKLGLGKVYYHQKNYLMAKDIFQELIEQNRSFVEAYDWLAKTYEQLGDSEEAQHVLEEAVKLSPKTILRQKELGRLSYKNKDLGTAETAFRRAIKIGRTSCYKAAGDYTNLAKVFIDKSKPTEALKTVSQVREEFGRDPASNLQASAMESIVHKVLGNEDMAEKALKDASQIFTDLSGKVPMEIAFDLARACYRLGKDEEGEAYLKNIIRNHHDDSAVLKAAQDFYAEIGKEEEGQKIIDATRQEVIDINNQGVKLATEGKLEESIDLFTKALSKMPDNQVINLNAAQSLIMYMQKHGKNDRHLYQTRQYLDRLEQIDPTNEKFQKLLTAYGKLVRGE